MNYIKACCSGMTNPTFYFSYSTSDLANAKVKIHAYLDSFVHLSIGCKEDKMFLLNETDEDYEKAINSAISLDK